MRASGADVCHRYVTRYIIRRLLRYAKYAAVGAIIAAVGGTLLGTLGGGLAFFAAPSIPVGMAIGLGTALVKVGLFPLMNVRIFGGRMCDVQRLLGGAMLCCI